MSLQAILLPVFALVALTFILMFWMGRERVGALKSREVRMKDIALGEPAWPQRATQIGNCFRNQFEFPVLFYALVAIALPLRQADLLFVLLSWVFVIARYAHAGIFVTSNNVTRRFYAFLASVIVLLIMWVVFALKILFAL